LVKEYAGSLVQAKEKSILLDVAGDTSIPSLANVVVAYGDYGNAVAVSLISEHLVGLLGFGDVKLMKSQYQDAVLLMASEYYFLNLKEWTIFFRRCKLGDYGQMVWGNKLNTQSLMCALKTFVRDRRDAIAKREQEELNKKLLQKDENAITWEEWQKMKHKANNKYYEVGRNHI